MRVIDLAEWLHFFLFVFVIQEIEQDTHSNPLHFWKACEGSYAGVTGCVGSSPQSQPKIH